MQTATAPATASDKVRQGLSELRTTVLGGQVLLGFQYETLFQSRFEPLAAADKRLALAAFAIMLAAVILMIAPSAFHQLAERGRRSNRQAGAIRWLMLVSLPPLAVGVGLNIVVTAGRVIGAAPAAAASGVAILAAFILWYGIELMSKTPSAPGREEPTPLKDQVADLLTETRIVLPGVQALLGIQFLAYLTEAFDKIPAPAKSAHTVALFLLLTAMILLMTPAPFHRLAEDGRETQRIRRVAQRCIVGGLIAIGGAFAADLFVATDVITRNLGFAYAAAAVVIVAAGAVWFVLPLAARKAR